MPFSTIITLIGNIIILLIIGEFFDQKPKLIKLTLGSLIMLIVPSIKYFVNITDFAFFLTTGAMYLAIKSIYEKSNKEIVFSIIFIDCFIAGIELLTSISIIFIFGYKTTVEFMASYSLDVFNIVFLISILILSKTKFLKICYDFLSEKFIRFNSKTLLFILYTFLIIFSYLLITNFIHDSILFNVFLTIISFLSMFMVAGYLYKSEQEKCELKEDTKMMKISQKDACKMVDDYRLKNHENNNILCTIRAMTNEQKVKNYIDLVGNSFEKKKKIKDDENIKFEAYKIDCLSLKSAIYNKIVEAHRKNIFVIYKIDDDLRKLPDEYIDDTEGAKITQIFNILVDNAMQELEKQKLDRAPYLGIEAYLENKNFIIAISNTFKGKIDLEKMTQDGYSTNGEGRGHGLTIVNELLKKNPQYTLNRKIYGNVIKLTLIYKKNNKYPKKERITIL
ncbi:MAG: GHKL domain-containing protein [Bacilli bacterium]